MPDFESKGQDVNIRNKLGHEKGGDENTSLPGARYIPANGVYGGLGGHRGSFG